MSPRPDVPSGDESESEPANDTGEAEGAPSNDLGKSDHVKVSGAGSKEWNGVYRPIEGETSDGVTVYAKDDTHRMERSDGAWHLARPGRYVAYRESAKAKAADAFAKARAAAEAARTAK